MSFTRFVSGRFFRSRHSDRFVSFITFIAVVGIALGSSALIIALSVLGGFEKEITEKVIGFTSHVQVMGYQHYLLRDPERTIALLRDSLGVVHQASPFVSREAIIRSRQGVDGVLLRGVVPGSDLLRTRRYLVEGRYDLAREEGATPKIVIGRKLARKLALEVGDKTAVFGLAGPVGEARLRVSQFQITGIYESGMAEYDDIVALTDLASAQRLFQTGDAVTGYDLLLQNVDSADVVVGRIDMLLGYPHFARSVFDSYRNVFSWIELQKKPVPVILGLIIIVATVNVIGTLLMMVLGKTRDIGVLLTLGATRGAVARIFIRQGLIIAVVGTAFGNLLAFGLCFVQLKFRILALPSDVYFMSSVPILLRWEYFVIVSSISVTLSFLCSLLPSRLAARLDPVKAIRFV
jgi:lipoprotein-releasing system permease protein